MPEGRPELKRELGLRDLTMFAIACIVGTRWIPAAAHAGPGSITLWLLETQTLHTFVLVKGISVLTLTTLTIAATIGVAAVVGGPEQLVALALCIFDAVPPH